MNTTVNSQISEQNFLALGVNDLAYIKAVEIDGQPRVSIHAADGTQVAVMPNRDAAIDTIIRNEMEPVSVH